MISKYFGVLGNRDHIKLHGKKRPIWEFLDRQPDGWLSSLVYAVKEIPPENPKMIWDCGAWSYRLQDEPTYSPEECLNLYRKFAYPQNILIAPDHMIIPGCNSKSRRKINLINADEFLFRIDPWYKPMATIHGESIEERIEVAHQLHKMGYQYLALGGMAAQASRRVLMIEIAKSIRKELPDVYLHVLGLSSPDYARQWSKIGINSFDGSSHFKQAFTGGTFFIRKGCKLIKHQAIRPGNTEYAGELTPSCDCKACLLLREDGIDTRSYGSNESNMGRACHNMNMLMMAQQEAMRKTVVLVACCGEKLKHPAPAKDLYQSPLFKKSRSYAEKFGDEWYILSAKYGVVTPNEIIAPYDLTLNNFTRAQENHWNCRVKSYMEPLLNEKIIILAGLKYCGWVRGYNIKRPMEHMGIGQQLKFLTEATQHEGSNFLPGFDLNR